MKTKLTRLFLALVLVSLTATALAAPAVDFTAYTFDELLSLQSQLTAALWASDGWQEVSVPSGMYKIGDEIPAGRWTLSCGQRSVHIGLYRTLDKYGEGDDYINSTGLYPDEDSSILVDLVNGAFLEVDGTVIFTPGVAAFSFK